MSTSKKNEKSISNFLIRNIFYNNLDVIRDLALIIKEYNDGMKEIKKILIDFDKEQLSKPRTLLEIEEIREYFNKINDVVQKLLSDVE